MFFSGLIWRPFHGFHDIQEIICSGETMPAEVDSVLFVGLYQWANKKAIATMNVNTKECTTSEDYNSCDVVDGDTRRSSLRALVWDLGEGQSRVYGCNVTALVSRSFVRTYSWTVTVRHVPRECTYCCLSLCVL